MDRRRFLGTGLIGGGVVGLEACAPAGAGLLTDASPPPPMSEEEVQQFLQELNGQMAYIRDAPPITEGFVTRSGAPAALRRQGEELARKSLRTLLLAGSFSDLPLEGQVHPDVQSRVIAGMKEMDEAASGMRAFLDRLTPTEKADIGRALSRDPDLGMKIVGTLDAEAAKIGISFQRRTHMRRLAVQICARMKQSTPMFLDDTLRKVEKVAAQDTDVLAVERRLLARMGEDEFSRLRRQVEEALAQWDVAQGRDLDWQYTDANQTTPVKRPSTPSSTSTGDSDVMTAGGALMGIGALFALIGAIIVASGAGGGALMFAFIGGFTIGGLLFLAGLITLIVGATMEDDG